MKSDNQRIDEALKLERQMAVLYRVGSFMSTLSDLDQLLVQIMRESQEVTEAEASSLALYDESTDELYFDVALGEKGEETKKIRMKRGEGILGHVALTGVAQNVLDVRKDGHFASWVDQTTGFHTRCILAVPLRRRDRLIGVVEVLNKRGGKTFTDEDQAILEVLAHQAAIAIENARLYRENMEKERLASLGRGIAGAAHCIKNVLNAIQGGGYMIDSGIQKGKSDRVVRGWDMIKRNNAFMSELVLDMLAYSKEREPQYIPTDINELCASICALIEEKARPMGVEVIFRGDESLQEVCVDATALRRALMNLMSNALDACEEGGRVEMSTQQRMEGRFQIAVEDTGCGIPEEDKKRIFEVFFSTKGSRGTGLGLAVTRKIIQEHDGTLEVVSEVGKGTSFTINLPALACP